MFTVAADFLLPVGHSPTPYSIVFIPASLTMNAKRCRLIKEATWTSYSVVDERLEPIECKHRTGIALLGNPLTHNHLTSTGATTRAACEPKFTRG